MVLFTSLDAVREYLSKIRKDMGFGYSYSTLGWLIVFMYDYVIKIVRSCSHSVFSQEEETDQCYFILSV